MAFFEYLTILFSFAIGFQVGFYVCQRRNSIIPINWPVLGNTPAILLNAHRLYEAATDILACTGGTFLLKGPVFAKMDMLCTTNPADINYIFSKNFHNYPKGDKYREIFDILGDGVVNSDGELWEYHRKMHTILLNHPSFQSLTKKTLWNKVENGLLPILDNVSRQGLEIDLQDIFQRFGFDVICKLFIDYDPQSMSIDLPYIPCEKAFSHMEEAIFFRHLLPTKIWKLQQFLGIGNEGRLSDAGKIIDQFVYKQLAEKLKDFNKTNYEPEKENFSFCRALIKEVRNQSVMPKDSNKFLRDIFVNLIVAGRDTTSIALSWFFYLLSKNPMAVDKIREELETQLVKCKDIQAIELSNLVYLHGGLCETLRLFPPIPFQNKNPIQADVLPSGYQVNPNTKIILCFHSMGRMESIWGKDCLEFKPERWLTSGGGIAHQPSHKFTAFNSGPRTCLGKNMSFTEMKIVAATIIHNYHVELVEGHPILPTGSIVFNMKHGLKVRLTKRNGV